MIACTPRGLSWGIDVPVVQLYYIHVDSVVDRAAMEYFHISKAGGTSWIAAASEWLHRWENKPGGREVSRVTYKAGRTIYTGCGRARGDTGGETEGVVQTGRPGAGAFKIQLNRPRNPRHAQGRGGIAGGLRAEAWWHVRFANGVSVFFPQRGGAAPSPSAAGSRAAPILPVPRPCSWEAV